jgi:23S rRNA (cytidine2498-2'-O)-methyltransferase
MPPAPSSAASPLNRGEFLLVCCQGGAEEILCDRQQQVLPQVRRGVWRRGVVTFRLPADFDPPDSFFPDLVFARAVIRSLGQVRGDTAADRVRDVGGLAGNAAWQNVHVWKRDAKTEGDVAAIRQSLLAGLSIDAAPDPIARPDELVLDCILDSADRWWVGWHRAEAPSSRWPGGAYPQTLPQDKVSRAWLKLDEAIATFAIPLQPGQRAVELGASPGGACQRLLEAGLSVVGIDPALVDERVARHERFEQWRMRSRDAKLRAFRGFDWVVADMNIDPTSTLEAIERIVTAPGVRPAGIVATLKLPQWSRAAALPEWLDRFRAWGYAPHARQLSTGGREICVFARRSARNGSVRNSSRPATRRRDR